MRAVGEELSTRIDLPVMKSFVISLPTISVPYPNPKSVFPLPAPTVHKYV